MAGINLGTAYVQVMPSAKGIKGSLVSALGGEGESAGQSAGSSAGAAFVAMLKKVVVAAGIGKFIKDSMAEAGALQQSYIGGLDTIYGAAADKAREYAKEAAKAGISMNEYAEQAVSFGASLRQAYGGDTAKAVEAANTAIMDMTDNAAKMGTPLASIQNAYQGFAKQNYTMLDNLKLGYGGTKQEMERLLADAEKLSGVKYDISNLGDVYEAIHVVQGELNLTGVAAAEAEGTFTGSMNAMRASIKNLMGNLALGNDISKDLEIVSVSLRTFVTKNMLPLFANIMKSIPAFLRQAIPEVASFVTEMLGEITGKSKEIEATAINIVRELVLGIIKAAPGIITAGAQLIATFKKTLSETHWELLAKELLTTLGNSLKEIAPGIFGKTNILWALISAVRNKIEDMAALGLEIVQGIASYITEALPGLLNSASEILNYLIVGIQLLLPTLTDVAVQLVQTLVTFIVDNLPLLASAAMGIISSLVSLIIEQLPNLLEAGGEILMSIVGGIAQTLPTLLETVGGGLLSLIGEIIASLPDFLAQGTEIVNSLLDGILQMLPDLLAQGGDMLMQLFDGIMNELPNIVDSAVAIVTTLLTTIANNLPQIVQEGMDILIKLVIGIIDAIPKIAQAAGDIITGFITAIVGNLDKIILAGINIIVQLALGLVQAIPRLVLQVPVIFRNLTSSFASQDWWGIGLNIIKGVANGIKNGVSWIVSAAKDAARSAFNAAKSLLKISSPSKLFKNEIGANIAFGMAEGIEDNISAVKDAMDDIATEAVVTVDPGAIASAAVPEAGRVAASVVNNITVNPSAGMNEEALADMVIQRITFTMQRTQAAWG